MTAKQNITRTFIKAAAYGLLWTGMPATAIMVVQEADKDAKTETRTLPEMQSEASVILARKGHVATSFNNYQQYPDMGFSFLTYQGGSTRYNIQCPAQKPCQLIYTGP